MSLPAVSNIDMNLLDVDEQWDMALSLWTTLRDAWAAEAVQRQISIPAQTPNIGILDILSVIFIIVFLMLDTSQSRVAQWEASLEQWRMDQQMWQSAATQLSSGFPQQDLASLNFSVTGED